MEKTLYQKVLSLFSINDEIVYCAPYGEGHINKTFLILTDKEQYVLQIINNNIFKDIDGLMNNIDLVTSFIKKKLIESSIDPKRYVLIFLESIYKKKYVKYLDMYFRLCFYIEDSMVYQKVDNLDLAYKAGFAFGNFSSLLCGFNSSLLVDTIPLFHDTVNRYHNLLKAIKEDKYNRVKDVKNEIDFFKGKEKYYPILISSLLDKSIPYKVTHNDTKINNVLFDAYNFEPLAVVDLDTVMKGTILFDFGDAIRTGATSAKEDENDLTKVHFLFDNYKAYVNGFLNALTNTITPKEKSLLGVSAIIMTLECGIRFLEDYINGDTYFKIKYPNQNLFRCRTQIKLVKEMEENLDKMNSLIKI